MDEEIGREKERSVNKENEKMIHDGSAESEKVEQWERRRGREMV